MWRDEVGMVEMLFTYIEEYERFSEWKNWRRILVDILSCHEEVMVQKRTLKMTPGDGADVDRKEEKEESELAENSAPTQFEAMETYSAPTPCLLPEAVELKLEEEEDDDDDDDVIILDCPPPPPEQRTCHTASAPLVSRPPPSCLLLPVTASVCAPAPPALPSLPSAPDVLRPYEVKLEHAVVSMEDACDESSDGAPPASLFPSELLPFEPPPRPGAKMRSAVSGPTRGRLIEAYERGDDYVALAALMGVKRRTAYGIVRAFKRTGRRLALARGGPRNQVVTSEMREALVSFVEENPTAILSDLRARLLERFPGSPVSLTTVSRHLDGALVILRPGSDEGGLAPPGEDLPTAELRLWATPEGGERTLVLVDECGFNLWTARRKCRSARVLRAVRMVCGERGQHLRLCFAVSPQRGLVHHAFMTGAVSGRAFADFTAAAAAAAAAAGPQGAVMIVRDNATPHADWSPALNDGHELRTVARTAPVFEAAELAVCELKEAVKRRLATGETRKSISDQGLADARGVTLHHHRMTVLRGVIAAELRVITRERCSAWFARISAAEEG